MSFCEMIVFRTAGFAFSMFFLSFSTCFLLSKIPSAARTVNLQTEHEHHSASFAHWGNRGAAQVITRRALDGYHDQSNGFNVLVVILYEGAKSPRGIGRLECCFTR
jgi:hypothetical protein